MSDLKKFAEAAKQKLGVESVEIGGKKYEIELLPARQAALLGAEILKLILPSIGALKDGANRGYYVLPEDDTLYTEASILLVNQMSKVNVADIIEVLTSNVKCHGQEVDIDTEFRGNVAGLIKLIKFALEKNIGPFGDWPKILGLRTQLEKMNSQEDM